MWFLEYLYENGGGEYRSQSFGSDLSYKIAGCGTSDEFYRIMTALRTHNFITFVALPFSRKYWAYSQVLLTGAGIKEIEKTKHIQPLIGLVQQEIYTGNPESDANIKHARALFLREPKTMENMRSACEALCYELEPLREKLKLVITAADVEAFFQLVNKFDIRHNKPHTMNLQHSEQLEWVFYSLLNTINAYTKLFARLNPGVKDRSMGFGFTTEAS